MMRPDHHMQVETCVRRSLLSTLYSLLSTLCSLLSALYSLLFTLYSLLSAVDCETFTVPTSRMLDHPGCVVVAVRELD